MFVDKSFLCTLQSLSESTLNSTPDSPVVICKEFEWDSEATLPSPSTTPPASPLIVPSDDVSIF